MVATRRVATAVRVATAELAVRDSRVLTEYSQPCRPLELPEAVAETPEPAAIPLTVTVVLAAMVAMAVPVVTVVREPTASVQTVQTPGTEGPAATAV